MFRESGLADELGSGMRNTYKYTRLYSGAEPEFVQGDVFQTIIPLSEAATVKVGSTMNSYDSEELNGEINGSSGVIVDKNHPELQ